MLKPDLLSNSKELCVAHQCPRCGARDHVTVERVASGTTVVTRCHCKVCGHSWHPQVGAVEA